MSSTSSVIAIANTPSLNASSRSVSKRSQMPLCSARPPGFLHAVTLAWLEDDHVAAAHLGLEGLGVRLDHGKGVVMAGDDLAGAHELRRLDGVVSIHRVMAADAHQGDVDRVALADEAQVREERRVAQVVRGLAAEVYH